MEIFEEIDRTNLEAGQIIQDAGLVGVFEDFEPDVKEEIEKAMRHILTKELQGLTPEQQIEKLKKMYTSQHKQGGRRRRKSRRKKRTKRRKKKTKKRRKSRRTKRRKKRGGINKLFPIHLLSDTGKLHYASNKFISKRLNTWWASISIQRQENIINNNNNHFAFEDAMDNLIALAMHEEQQQQQQQNQQGGRKKKTRTRKRRKSRRKRKR